MTSHDWNDWQAFTCVAELGSFTRAAERLARPKSWVSMAVARLEQQLGLRLLERSTRKLRLTDDGQRLLSQLSPLFARLGEIADAARDTRDEPRGVLRIATPYEFGSMSLGEVVCEVLARYPELEIDVDIVSRPLDPAAEGYDIVFVLTAEPLPDSDQVARRVYSLARGLYAAPELVGRLGEPESPSALTAWPVLTVPNEPRWRFRGPDGVEQTVELKPHLRTASAALRLRATLSGQGATLISRRLAQASVNSGELVALLPEYEPLPWRIYAFLPGRRLLPAKTRVFLSALEQAVLSE